MTDKFPPLRRRAGRTFTGEVPAQVACFASLPDDALVDKPTVEFVMALSPASVDRAIRAGKLPRPVKIGRASRYRVGEVRAALAALSAWRA